MKANLTLVTPERQAELKEAWNLIAEKKGGLRKKEVYKVMRALGMVRPPGVLRSRVSRVGFDRYFKKSLRESATSGNIL